MQQEPPPAFCMGRLISQTISVRDHSGSYLECHECIDCGEGGTFTINGTIIEIGGTSPDINLTDTISSVATTIGAQVSGVTAQVDAASGKLVLESNSEIVLGHADDTSNFLGVMKLFSQSEPNYDSISGYYSKTEGATATTTSNFYRQGEYLWNGSNYFEALQDVSRGTDISSIPDSNFGSVKQVDSITGLAGDSPVAEV